MDSRPLLYLPNPARQSGAKPYFQKKFLPPETKTSPMAPPLLKSETNFRFLNGGDMGEVLGERGRFGGRDDRFCNAKSCQ